MSLPYKQLFCRYNLTSGLGDDIGSVDHIEDHVSLYEQQLPIEDNEHHSAFPESRKKQGCEQHRKTLESGWVLQVITLACNALALHT